MWNEILSKLESKYGQSSMNRVHKMLTETPKDKKSRHPWQNGAKYILPNLSERMVMELEDYPEFSQAGDRFGDKHSRIRDEILGYLDRTGRPETHGGYGTLEGDQWRVVFLNRIGRDEAKVVPSFPETMGYIRSCAPILYPIAGISFSVLEPGAHITPHCDRTNVFIHFHQSVIAPSGCGLKVGDRELVFEEKKSYLFDPSFVHEAWNRSAYNRIHLILPVWHPGITHPEREALTEIFSILRELSGGRMEA
jgi:Aspartyl/Asparaginyl beta-hydroxylase